MLDFVKQHDSPVRRNHLESEAAAQGPAVQKRLRSPRPAKKRQGIGPERAIDPALAACSYGDDAVNGLSQLSDLVILDASQDANLSQDYPAEVASQHFPSQEVQDAPPSNDSQVMLETPPSQPDIPLATLAVSSAQADPPPDQAVDPIPTFPLPVQQPMVPQRLSGMSSPLMQDMKDPNLLPLHPKSRATRRGPMDEMRQLVRILVKVIPHSVALISSSEEGGGGNRISEDQIKSYLENALGDAPKPVWGLPGGWGDYCAELFNWVLEPKKITMDQAMRCAKREPGRSWEAIEPELNKLGLYPSTWPLPLTRQGLAEAAQNPVLQPIPTGPVAVKRQSSHHGSDGGPTIKAEKGSRRKVSGGSAAAAVPSRPADTELDKLSETEVWLRLQRLMEVAKQKQGTSTAEDAMAVSSAQLQVHKLMQDFAFSRPGLLPGVLAPPGGSLLPLAPPSGPGLNENQLALVPVMIQNPDGTFTGAYQVQPYPSGFSTEGVPSELTGFGDVPVITAPPMALNMPLSSGPGTAFQAVQLSRPLLAGGLTSPHGRSIAKPQPIRPRIGLPTSGALPSAALNGFQPDGQHAGSASPSTEENDEEHREFDIGSILRPTPVKAETVRRAGESQDAASQSLPIRRLHTPDLAALQGSQGIATSLSVLQNDLQNHAWQHLDGASQQNVAGQNGSIRQAGQLQESSQQGAAAMHSCNGGVMKTAVHVNCRFDQRPGPSQQQSQQCSQREVGLLQMPSESNSGSQQQARLPKRKLPFSIGIQPDAKRQSPGPDSAINLDQSCHGQTAAAQGTPDRQRNVALAFVSPQKSPSGQSKAQLMSPSLLLVAQQESSSHLLAQQQTAHIQSSAPVSVGLHAQNNRTHWTSTASAMLQ